MSASANGSSSDLEIAMTAVIDEICANERFLITTHEGPDGDALGSTLALHQALTQLGRDSVDLPRREGVPAAGRVSVPAAPGGLPRASRRPLRPDRDLPRLRQHRPDAGRLAARRQADAQRRPPSRQHPLRRCQPGRRRGVVDRRDRLRDLQAARRRGDRLDRPGPLRRADHRHRHVHVREHRRPHPSGRGGADRGRRRRQRDLPAALRARARGEAEADRPGARADRPAARRSPLDHVPLRRRLRRDRRRRDAHRGDHRLRPRDRGHLRRRGRPRQARRASARRARSACARPTAPSTSRSSPARWAAAGTARAAGFSTDQQLRRAVEFLSDETRAGLA